MNQLLNFLVTQIVDRPEAVRIETKNDAAGTVILTLTVAPEDMGRVIGKGGKIIAAIRELVKVKALMTGRRVRVILAEPSILPEAATPQTDSLSPRSLTAPPDETT
jgi:hypothetical protein